MKAINRILLFLLHFGATVGVQICLFQMMLRSTDTSSGIGLGLILLAVGTCLADLALSMILLKGHDLGRYAGIFLQFWDLLLISPLFMLGIVSLFSGKTGAAFGTAVLLIDLLLIVERSVSFVLRNPKEQDPEPDRG